MKIAQAPHTPLLPTTSPESYGWTEVIWFLGNILRLAIGLMVFVAIIYVIIGGYKYITGGGNPEQVGQAKATMMWAIIGLLIGVTSYLIVAFVWNRFAAVPLPGF